MKLQMELEMAVAVSKFGAKRVEVKLITRISSTTATTDKALYLVSHFWIIYFEYYFAYWGIPFITEFTRQIYSQKQVEADSCCRRWDSDSAWRRTVLAVRFVELEPNTNYISNSNLQNNFVD